MIEATAAVISSVVSKRRGLPSGKRRMEYNTFSPHSSLNYRPAASETDLH
jgi:hypothetical protein